MDIENTVKHLFTFLELVNFQ